MKRTMIALALLGAAPATAKSISGADYDAVKAAITITTDPYSGERHLNAPEISNPSSRNTYVASGYIKGNVSVLGLTSYVVDYGPFRVVRAAAFGGDIPVSAGHADVITCGTTAYSRCLDSFTVSFELTPDLIKKSEDSWLAYRLYTDDGRTFDFDVPTNYIRAVADSWASLSAKP